MNDSIASGVVAWLLTYAIHSTALLGMAWLVLRWRRSDPSVSDLLWKVALIGGVITATAQTVLDVRPSGSVAFGAVATVSDPGTLRDASSGEAEAPARTAPIRSEQSALPTASTATPTVVAPRASTAAGLLAVGWAALAVLLLAWYGGRRLILVGRLGDRRVLVDGELPASLAALCVQAGVRRPVRLTASTAISSPVALGGREICLPAAALAELEPIQQRAMLAHELAHLVRRDPQWLALACTIERVFFFQPLNRLARRGVQESAEYLADEWAARLSGGVPLARCLVKVAEWIEASPLGVPVAGMAEQRSQLSSRVTRLLERGAFAPRRQPLAGMLSVGALVGTVLLAPGVAGHRPAEDPYRIPRDADLGLERPDDGAWQPTMAARDEGESTNTNTSTNTDVNDGRVVFTNQGNATETTSSSRDTVVVRALMLRLKDEDAEVRRAAAHALGRIENPMAIPALVAALDDADREVVHAALDALSNFDRGVPAAPVRRLLQAEDPEVRGEAIQILGELRDRESIPAIARLVRDPDADVRQQALHALAELRDPATAAAVAGAVNDEDRDVREAALYALRELGATVPDAVLTAALRDVDADVREAALRLVEDRRVVSMVPEVIRLLDDPNGDVRECAVETLAELRTEPARAALRRALTHADPKVRRVAVEFFGEEGDT